MSLDQKDLDEIEKFALQALPTDPCIDRVLVTVPHPSGPDTVPDYHLIAAQKSGKVTALPS